MSKKLKWQCLRNGCFTRNMVVYYKKFKTWPKQGIDAIRRENHALLAKTCLPH